MGRRLILLLPGIGGVVVVLVIAFALVAGSFREASESMAPTLGLGSRFWGPVPEDWVVGKLSFVYKD